MAGFKANYPGMCKRCGGHFAAGVSIKTVSGGYGHVSCPSAPAPKPRAASAAKPRAKKAKSPPPVAGEQTVTKRSLGRDDGYDVGATSYFSRIAGGGGPDGHYWTVVEQTGKWRDDDTDEWMVSARIRPATDAEAAPVAARRGVAADRAALARDIGALRGERTHDPMPATAVVLVPRDTNKLCATGERIALVDGLILHERVGDPDMCDSWYHYVVRVEGADSALVARVEAYIAASRI